MAKLNVVEDSVLRIPEFFGVNETEPTKLKLGEDSTSTNWRIIDGNKQKRPGTQNVANLIFNYAISVDSNLTTVLTETISTTASFTCYPTCDIADGGLMKLTGTPVTVAFANIGSYTNYYYQDTNGVIYKLGTCTYVAGIGNTAYRWEKWDAIYGVNSYWVGPHLGPVDPNTGYPIIIPGHYEYYSYTNKGTTNYGFVYGAVAYPPD